MSGVMKGMRVPERLSEILRKTQTPEWQARADAQFEYIDRDWVGLMRGVRVEGDTVIISVKGGNEAARELCGALIKEMEA